MHTISGEGYLSNKVNAAGTYYAFLVIDGQKIRRSTGTKNLDEAMDFLTEWKAQVKVGVVGGDKRLRYEDIRDNYLKSGKTPEPAQLEDLNKYFKDRYVSSIKPGIIQEFRDWRESKPEVVEYKDETLQKEIALRKLRASENGKRKLSARQVSETEAEARKWVENGVKATTNRRLNVLRAMFYRAAKDELVERTDIPTSFCQWEGVDNVKTNKYSEQDFENILNELPTNLHPLVLFLYNTGMRSGQARKITWDMIDQNVLRIPGLLTKNKKPYTLPLVSSKHKPYDWSEYIVNRPKKNRHHGERVFDDINLRIEWQRACHKLGLGIFDEKTRVYRGASLHDFRRTAVTRMNEKGISRGTAMAVSGHKTESMYARYGIEDLKTVQTALDTMSD